MFVRVLMLIAGAMFVGFAWAGSGWKPQLSTPQHEGYRSPREPLKLFIPPDVPLEVLRNLALELDGIDVTAYIQREGDYVIYTPVQPLAYGMHQLRVVEYAPDGSIIERGAWQVEVRKSAAFREASLTAQASIEVSQRVADHNLGSPAPVKNQRNGTLQVDGSLADGDWQAGIKLPVIYSSGQPYNDVDVGEFRFDWQRHGVTAVIGHQTVGQGSLVMSGFNRRGLSLGYKDDTSGMAFGAFSVRGSSITGVKHGLGVGNRNDRIQGGRFTYYPLRGNGRLLQISGVYLDGKSPEAGVGETGSTLSTGGHAWSLSADSLLLDNRLRLRGEYAGTSYDFDGSGGNPAETDHAVALLATYQPWSGKTVGTSTVDWLYGVEFRKVGTFFRSPADPGGVADRRMGRVFSQLTWGDLSATAQWAQETDNVNDLAGLPRQRTRSGVLDFSYNPQPEYDDQGQPRLGLLGQQSYTLSLGRELRATTKGAAVSDRVDQKTNTIQAAANFTYSNWSWGLSHDRTRVTDNSLSAGIPTGGSTSSQSTTLNGSFSFFDDFTLASRITQDKTRYRDRGYTDHGIDWGVDLTANLVPNKLSGQLGFSMNHSWASDHSSNTRTGQIGMDLTWTVIQAKESRPGLALSLDGSYSHVKDNVDPFSSKTDYQVFFKAKVDWAGMY